MNVDEAEWEWLKPHVERDAVILVARELDMNLVANSLVDDVTEAVDGWIQRGQLTKPTTEQLAHWDAQPSKRFLSLVVQPFVLVQEIILN